MISTWKKWKKLYIPRTTYRKEEINKLATQCTAAYKVKRGKCKSDSQYQMNKA